MECGCGQNSPAPLVGEKNEREKVQGKLGLSQVESQWSCTVQPLTQPRGAMGKVSREQEGEGGEGER
jgi:hypothetical protein